MLMQMNKPEEAYRRVCFDARIKGASPEELVRLCFEQVVAGLAIALRAQESGDAARRSAGLTRAHAALTALDMGIDPQAPLAEALRQLYASARGAILTSVTAFDAVALARVRDDFREIGEAFAA